MKYCFHELTVGARVDLGEPCAIRRPMNEPERTKMQALRNYAKKHGWHVELGYDFDRNVHLGVRLR